MIKSLQIQNIQSHKNTLLEFSPGVNMIIGKSDHGKSAILNALFWCIYNRPLGDTHRNWDGGVMKVKTVLDNGVVEISRGKQTEYKVTQNKKTKKFKASGTAPPQEVTDLFNIDRKINVQKQIEKDAHIFLLSESPGEVAAFFNKVAGLYKIDETISQGKSDLRKTETTLQTTKDQIFEKQKTLEKYNGIDDLYSKVVLCEQITLKCTENDQILNNIGVSLYEIGKVASLLTNLTDKLYIKEKVDEAIVVQDKIRDTLVFLQKTTMIMDKIKSTEQRDFLLNDKIKIKTKTEEALQIHEKIKERGKQHLSIWEYTEGIREKQNKQKELKEKGNKLETKFHELMPDQCPLCGSEL